MKRDNGELLDILKLSGDKSWLDCNLDLMERLDKKKVAIYGAGNLGRQVF